MILYLLYKYFPLDTTDGTTAKANTNTSDSRNTEPDGVQTEASKFISPY